MGLSYCVVITRRTEEIIDVAFCPVFGEISPLRIRAIFACQFAVLIGADCVRLLASVERDSVGCFTDHVILAVFTELLRSSKYYLFYLTVQRYGFFLICANFCTIIFNKNDIFFLACKAAFFFVT